MTRPEPPPSSVLRETAEAHATHRVPRASPGDSVAAVRQRLLGERFDTAAAVAVCEAETLRGIVRLEDLLAASGTAAVADVMDAQPPVVHPGADQEVAAWHAVRRRETVLAVVDEQDRFAGFVPPERLLTVLLAEHEEDLARLGGFLHDVSQARSAMQEGLARRFWHRLPWLIVGLVGAWAAAGLVGSFERQLQGNLVLAFFVPGIVYLADAVGTQTETLLVRGLSVGIRVREIVWRELATGVLVAGALALLCLPMAWWLWERRDVAIAVTLALAAACTTATAVAMALPALFHRLGWDPAFGSGPLATVVQDLLSILLYFLIAARVVH